MISNIEKDKRLIRKPHLLAEERIQYFERQDMLYLNDFSNDESFNVILMFGAEYDQQTKQVIPFVDVFMQFYQDNTVMVEQSYQYRVYY